MSGWWLSQSSGLSYDILCMEEPFSLAIFSCLRLVEVYSCRLALGSLRSFTGSDAPGLGRFPKNYKIKSN